MKEEKQGRSRQKPHQKATAKETREIKHLETAMESLRVSEPEGSKSRRPRPRSRQCGAAAQTLHPSPKEAELPFLEDILGLKAEPGPLKYGSHSEQPTSVVTKKVPCTSDIITAALQSKTSPRKQLKRRQPRVSSGHAYSVETDNGYWTADGAPDDEPDMQHKEDSETASTSTSTRKRDDKKRIPRVSIIDLT